MVNNRLKTESYKIETWYGSSSDEDLSRWREILPGMNPGRFEDEKRALAGAGDRGGADAEIEAQSE